MVVRDLDVREPPVAHKAFSGYWGKRIAVSGSLTYNSHKNGDFIAKTLNALYPLFVIQGGDDGADRWVQVWCLQTNTGFASVPCHHRGILRPEASIRKQHEWMMELDPDLVIVFPGAHLNVAKVAKRAQVPVLSITPEMFDVTEPKACPPPTLAIRPAVE